MFAEHAPPAPPTARRRTGALPITVLIAANQPLAERLGHALFDGQLYFSGGAQLALVAPWAEGERLAVTGWMLT